MKHFSRDMRPLQSWAPTSSVTLTRQLQEGHKKTLDVVLEIPKNYLVTLKKNISKLPTNSRLILSTNDESRSWIRIGFHLDPDPRGLC